MRLSVDDLDDIYIDAGAEIDLPDLLVQRLKLFDKPSSGNNSVVAGDLSFINAADPASEKVFIRKHRKMHSLAASLPRQVSYQKMRSVTQTPSPEEVADFKRNNETYVKKVEKSTHEALDSLRRGRALRQSTILERVRQDLESERRAREEKEEQARVIEAARIAREKQARELRERAEAEKKQAAEQQRKRAEEEAKRQKEQQEADRKATEKRQEEAREKQLKEAQQAQEAEKKAQAEAAAKARAQADADAKRQLAADTEAREKEQSKGCGTDWSEVNQEFDQNAAKIQWIKTNINQAVSADPALKSASFKIKIQLKPKIGQLTNSKQQLFRIRNEVREILNFTRTQGSDLLFKWTLNMFSKFILQQSESEANVAMQAALPLAMLTILIWSEFPDLAEFIIPRFIKKCPLVIGYSCPTDTESGRKRMGYKRGDNKWESEDKYSERMAGICSVWSAMTQSKLSVAQKIKHPYPIYHGWTFLARQLNRPTNEVTNADCCVMASWWDMSALRFLEAFGRQGEKMLEITYNEFTNSIADKKFPAAARLRLLGEDWRREGVLKTGWKQLEA